MMAQVFQGWNNVAKALVQRVQATQSSTKPNEGQRKMLSALAARLPQHGVIIADEVGMGKTLVAAEVVRAVQDCGGRIAILVPTGLGPQWQDELRSVDITTRDILRSMDSFWVGLQNDQGASHRTWLDESVVLISHTFVNWRFSGNSGSWRYDLLPVMLGLWRKEQEGRFPRGYRNSRNGHEACFEDVAARCISLCKDDDGHPMTRRFAEIAQAVPGGCHIYCGESYAKGSSCCQALEKCVGMALGGFDLIVIDEAHKNRADMSGLSRSLDSLLLRNTRCRVVGMTATPVELGCEQWAGMLQRIGADTATADKARIAGEAYVKAVNFLQTGAWRHDEAAVNNFIRTADSFKQMMAPWVLRRSKAEDRDVQHYKNLAQTDITYSYHSERDVPVAVADLDTTWQKAVCIAEALSLASRGLADYCTQRLRLTMGSGYGIAALLDTITKNEGDEEVQATPVAEKKPDTMVQEKRLARVAWWQALLKQNFSHQHSLHEHPAIAAAVHRIEEITERGEKVLVFGTYTKPLQALDNLLNARYMVRCFRQKIPVPQETIPPALQHAVGIALRQYGMDGDVAAVQTWLKRQYAAQRQKRRAFQDSMQELKQHLSTTSSHRVQMLYAAMLEDKNRSDQDTSVLALLTPALEEVLGDKVLGEVAPQDVAQAFKDLIGHICTSDEGDTDKDGELDSQEAGSLWRVIMDRLRQDYSSPRGSFSRMLHGQTAHASRRTAQLAFNRQHSRLRVLVAQSRVGREGLNLHKCCRHVLLLHPEWNPGVVEQQMGRVDRVGSYWAELLHACEKGCPPEDIPKIMLHCVIFKGTYDEHQWAVLNERRRSLRAQFYGEILPAQDKESLTTYEKDMLHRVMASVPSFSPRAD